MNLNEFLAGKQLAAPQTKAQAAVAKAVTSTPFLDFLEESPAKKLGFDGFLDEAGAFKPFAFDLTKVGLEDLQANASSHYGMGVGTTYGWLTIALYWVKAVESQGKSPNPDLVWALNWCMIQAHEGGSLGGYTPEWTLLREVFGSYGRSGQVRLVFTAEGETLVDPDTEDLKDKEVREDHRGVEALVRVVKLADKRDIAAGQAKVLGRIANIKAAMGWVESGKVPKKAGHIAYAQHGPGTVMEFAAVCLVLRRASKGISDGNELLRNPEEEGSDRCPAALNLQREVVDRFFGDHLPATKKLVYRALHIGRRRARLKYGIVG